MFSDGVDFLNHRAAAQQLFRDCFEVRHRDRLYRQTQQRRLRPPYGPGWALVGDAGYFKDPLPAHGITDALRDAELLARAAVDGSPTSFARYESDRDSALARPLVEVAERIAAYDWDLTDVEDLLRAESAAMRPEVAVVRAFGQPVRTPQAA